jgi:hypothetical protein
MKILNFYGLSYYFTPQKNIVSNDPNVPLVNNASVAGNKIIFFTGDLPDTQTLYNITTESALLDAFGSQKIMEVDDLNIIYEYDNETKTKRIKKVPVDALDVPFLIDGTIGWAAIILNDVNNPDEAEKIILFTDSIGGWGDQTSPIIIDKFTGKAGENNIFKDFSLILKDVSTFEQ